MGDHIELRLLGATSIVVGGERQIATGRASLLLSLLAARLNAVVGSNVLAEAIWPDGASRTALHQLVSRVRKLLGSTGSVRLETTAVGYRLAAPPDVVDVTCLEAAIALGREEMTEGRPGAAEAAFRRADELWGEPFGSWADHEQLAAEATRIREVHASLEDELSDAILAQDDYSEQIDRFQRLVDSAPLRERRWCQLMTALYRSGRQTDALRCAQLARRYLADEIGVNPGSELLALEAAILAHDPELTTVPPARPGFRFPAEVTSFVGRDAECDELRQLIGAHRLVTVCGPGGVGKSRIALAVIRRLAVGVRDGAVYVELSELGDVGSIVDALADAVGMSPHRRHDAALVTTRLSGRQCLVLLDNCERASAEVAMLAERILTMCPEVSIVATSQHPLGILGETRWRVPPMSTRSSGRSDAEALFLERALGDDHSAWSRDDVRALFQHLDGLPLALELAAALTPALSPRELLDRLDDRFELLALERDTVPRHHATLEATLDRSYRLLSAPAVALLDRLSAFDGEFSIEAATTVSSRAVPGDASVVSLLNELVSRSMVETESAPDHTRYYLLESVRLFAARRLASSADRSDTVVLDDGAEQGTRAGRTRT